MSVQVKVSTQAQPSTGKVQMHPITVQKHKNEQRNILSYLSPGLTV